LTYIQTWWNCPTCGQTLFPGLRHYCPGPPKFFPQPFQWDEVTTTAGLSDKPPERPTKEQMFARMAQVVAERGTCERLRVGAIVASEDMSTVYSMGYNGRQRGAPNNCERPGDKGNCGCLHAEENALLKAPYGPSLVMFVTHLPCVQCAKRICNSSVSRVYYVSDYTYQETRDILAAAGIPLIEVKL
jgi:dCMP deaminase